MDISSLAQVFLKSRNFALLGITEHVYYTVCVLSGARNLNGNSLSLHVQVVLRRRLDVIKSASEP
jgi:hypothetical protein